MSENYVNKIFYDTVLLFFRGFAKYDTVACGACNNFSHLLESLKKRLIKII